MSSIFSTPKAPKAPDPAATVEATAKANQVTQLTPAGNLVYGTYSNGQFVPSEDHTALQISESDSDRQLREGGNQISLALLNSLQAGGAGNLSPVRTAGSIEAGLSPFSTDFSGDAQRAGQSMYDASVQRLQPQMDRQRRQIEQRLADQGLPVGSEAYKEELNRLEASQGDQLSQLSLQSVQAGNAEQDRLARLSAALRGQQYNEQSGFTSLENQARASQFGELGSLLGFASPFQQYSTPNIDVGGIINGGYQNQLNAYGQQQKAQAANAAAVGNLVGSAASMAGGPATAFGYQLWGSDINIKENIIPRGMENGFNTYEFNYKNSKSKFIGVMAQEVREIMPEAVFDTPFGLAVDYGKIGVEFRRLD